MNFKWLGSKIDCYSDNPLLEKGYFEFYTSFLYNGEEFQVGEFAVFKQKNKADFTRIGRLLCIFQSLEGEANHSGLVRWYSWRRNLPCELNHTGIKFDQNNEIVEEMPSSDTIAFLKDIKRKCNVFFATLDEPSCLIKENNLDPNIYFSCRYKIKHRQLVPYFSEDIADLDYFVGSELNELEGTLENKRMDISTVLNDTSSFTNTTTPIKVAKYNKRRSSQSIINLNSEGSSTEEDYVVKVRSPSNPSKNLKLTPKSDKKLNGSLLAPKNLSVKRVLNDSFDDHQLSPSGIPIYSYSISNLNQNDPLKIKLSKLTENSTNIKLNVFPTKLDDEIVHTKSPIKIIDIEKINNHIQFSPNSKTKMSGIKSDINTRSRQVEFPYTPAQIGSTRRRSSRTLERKSYAEFYPLEDVTPKKRVRRGSTDSHRSTPIKEIKGSTTKSLNKIIEDEDVTKNSKTNHSEGKNNSASTENVFFVTSPRPKRCVGTPQRYRDDSCNMKNSTPKQNNNKNVDGVTSTRLTRSVGRSKKQNDDINDKNTNSGRGRPKKKFVDSDLSTDEWESDYGNQKNNMNNVKSIKLTRNPGRPKKYIDSDDDKSTSSSKLKRNIGSLRKNIETEESDSDYEPNEKIKSQIKNNSKTPTRTPYSTTKNPTDNIRKSVLKNSCKKLLYAESDEESFVPQTPKSQKQKSSPKSIVKDTPTARARMIREGIITPSVQTRNKAVLKDNTPLSKARTQLHVSFVPKSLPCREKEFSDIINFLEGKLLDGCGGCMYVSGVPGTGKTATVTEVIRTLQKSVETRDLPSFTYVNINGMRLSEPRQSYVEIGRQLTGKTVHWEQAQTMLENRFVKSRKKSEPIILVVDELDILCTKRQDVVYNLLDWPTKANAQLIVITIANTMDLPERLLMGRVTSRLGLTRLTFQAYTHKQLQEIVSKRLAGISAFNPDAIQLVARKVASVSGDARRALDICRRAVEIAELEGKHALVSMVHVNQALNAMITQPKVQAIKRCSRLEKLLLQAVVQEVERTGVEETNFASILTMLVTIATLDGFQMVSSTIAMAAVSKLSACRLLLTDQKHNNIYQKIILNVSSDDVYYALTKTDL